MIGSAVLLLVVVAFGAGTASAAFPGQNGEIAFARFDGTDNEIFIMDALGRTRSR